VPPVHRFHRRFEQGFETLLVQHFAGRSEFPAPVAEQQQASVRDTRREIDVVQAGDHASTVISQLPEYAQRVDLVLWIEVVIESDVNILDIAALSVLVTEAGGVFTDLNGNPPGLATRSVLAAPPALHAHYLGMLQGFVD